MARLADVTSDAGQTGVGVKMPQSFRALRLGEALSALRQHVNNKSRREREPASIATQVPEAAKPVWAIVQPVPEVTYAQVTEVAVELTVGVIVTLQVPTAVVPVIRIAPVVGVRVIVP